MLQINVFLSFFQIDGTYNQPEGLRTEPAPWPLVMHIFKVDRLYHG